MCDGRLLEPLKNLSDCLQHTKRAHFIMINGLWLKSCQIHPKDSVLSQKNPANENKGFEPKSLQSNVWELGRQGSGQPKKDPRVLQISFSDLWVLDWTTLSFLFQFNVTERAQQDFHYCRNIALHPFFCFSLCKCIWWSGILVQVSVTLMPSDILSDKV